MLLLTFSHRASSSLILGCKLPDTVNRLYYKKKTNYLHGLRKFLFDVNYEFTVNEKTKV